MVASEACATKREARQDDVTEIKNSASTLHKVGVRVEIRLLIQPVQSPTGSRGRRHWQRASVENIDNDMNTCIGGGAATSKFGREISGLGIEDDPLCSHQAAVAPPDHPWPLLVASTATFHTASFRRFAPRLPVGKAATIPQDMTVAASDGGNGGLEAFPAGRPVAIHHQWGGFVVGQLAQAEFVIPGVECNFLGTTLAIRDVDRTFDVTFRVTRCNSRVDHHNTGCARLSDIVGRNNLRPRQPTRGVRLRRTNDQNGKQSRSGEPQHGRNQHLH